MAFRVFCQNLRAFYWWYGYSLGHFQRQPNDQKWESRVRKTSMIPTTCKAYAIRRIRAMGSHWFPREFGVQLKLTLSAVRLLISHVPRAERNVLYLAVRRFGRRIPAAELCRLHP